MSFIFFCSTKVFALPILIDTDMGQDDWIAILYLLQNPQANVAGIVVDGNGLAHLEPGKINAQKLLALANKKNIPIMSGAEKSLSGHEAFPDADRNSADDLPLPELISKQELTLLQWTKSSREKIDVISLGTLTTLAELFEKDPAIKNKINRIVIMGGAIHVPGNINLVRKNDKNIYAEWNVFLDPLAAKKVFSSGIPIILVPLDATHQAPLTLGFLNQLKKQKKTQIADFVYQVLNHSKFYIENNQYDFWDPLAAFIALYLEDCERKKEKINVITEEGDQWGRTYIDPNGFMIERVTKIPIEYFKQDLIKQLNR